MNKEEEKALIKNLQSNDIEFNKAIETIREEGNNTILFEIAKLYDTFSNENKIKVNSIFNDLKIQESASVLIKIIENIKSDETRIMVLSACWQSRLNFIDYLEAFIIIVLSEPFEFAFEAFTVIDNIESKVDKNRKDELIDFIKSNIKICLESNQALAHDLIDIINSYDEA